MKPYMKEYISQLLAKYMDGATTLEEEDVLACYFRQEDVPAEWHDYQMLFREIDAMKPPTSAQPVRRRWLRWSAAAVTVGALFAATMLYMEQPPQTSPAFTAKVEYKDTADVQRPQISDKQMPTDTTVTRRIPERQMTPKQKRRSLRKPEPTMTDYDKGYALLAKAEEEHRQVEQQIMEARQQIVEARQEMIHAQLTAAGFVAIQDEDGNTIYINDPKEYFAYEE